MGIDKTFLEELRSLPAEDFVKVITLLEDHPQLSGYMHEILLPKLKALKQNNRNKLQNIFDRENAYVMTLCKSLIESRDQDRIEATKRNFKNNHDKNS